MQGMSASTTNANYSPVQHVVSPPITIVLTVLLLVFFFVGFFSIYFCKCFMDHILTSLQHTPSGDLVGTAVAPKEGLDVSLIQSFPTFEYASVNDFRIEKYGLECAICLVEFEDDSMLRLLTECCHVFHKDCIDLWLESHKTCPFCRRNLEVVAPSLADKSPVLAHENDAMQDIHVGHELVLLDLDAVRIDIKDEQSQDHCHQGSNDSGNNIMVSQGEQNSSSTTQDRDRDQDHDQNHDRNEENETERFSRSHSTGHSIVRPRAEEDRYTLRLPEHVKIKLIRGHHNWTGSCTTFGEFSRQGDTAGASRFGEASGSAGGGDINKLASVFVSNLSGSSMMEIAALTTIIPILILLRHSVGSHRAVDVVSKKNDDAVVGSKGWAAYMASMSLDFLLIIVPIILVYTVLAEWMYIWATLLILLLLFSIAAKRFGSYSTLKEDPFSIRQTFSSYRVATMIITCVCILAVDFTIFPRRYAKTETYGTGWMDLGVGSFVIANSLVSRQARNISSRSWKTAIQSASPLIILGFARLLSTTGVDYQLHVAEYGVHWNFFFTLAAISILTSIINIPMQYSGILGSLILVGYQVCLMHGLNSYLLSNERGTDIISQNKEGFFSIFGYWGMYLVGVQLGNFLLFNYHSSATMGSNKWATIRVWILSLLLWLLTVIIDRHVERVSRRMCNLAYVTLVLAVNLQVLAIFLLSDFLPGSKTSVLEEAYNRNLLGTFLLANLLTGLVNLMVETLFASAVKALFILIAYTFSTTFIIGLLDYCGIRLKFCHLCLQLSHPTQHAYAQARTHAERQEGPSALLE
ncbi:hypothetical protein C1H46_017405 [Malus baccata]|uniref:RING-type E3 ubiquitin transferase n=1 Tax=Malus baccata TaxID=106549 RepID=A0A540ME39_MALBA|nr:hypothetical protein C1H46_017405 [Malus baccata]